MLNTYKTCRSKLAKNLKHILCLGLALSAEARSQSVPPNTLFYRLQKNEIKNLACYYNDASIRPDFFHFSANIDTKNLEMQNAQYRLVSPFPAPSVNLDYILIEQSILQLNYQNPDYYKFHLQQKADETSSYYILIPRNYQSSENFEAYIFQSPQENEENATAFNCKLH